MKTKKEEDEIKKLEPVHCSCGKETFKVYNINDVELIISCGECGVIWHIIRRTKKEEKVKS